jgi:hypothetical protein
MQHAISSDDRDLLARFTANEIEPGHFHHREHVRLAYIFLALYGPGQAHQEFRKRLQAFLRHNAIDPAKYHETMTQAWMLAVQHFMEISPPQASVEDFIQANPVLLDPKIMLTHYSREAIGSDQARRHFVEPDKEPIPRHAGRSDVT